MDQLPILWSFRRCPYAMRARLAIAAADLVVELREVDLACRPPELREAWPAATVPLLQGRDGLLIGESLEVMLWALAQRDPGRWLELPASAPLAADAVAAPLASGPADRGSAGPGSAGGGEPPPGGVGHASDDGSEDGAAAVAHPPARAGTEGPRGAAGAKSRTPALAAPIATLVAENDGPFKHHLDRFKYANRFPDADPEHHRRQALAILCRWNDLLRCNGEAPGGWLLGRRSCLADWALLPFVRQFRLADPQAFARAEGLDALRLWLARFEAGPELAAVMAPPLAERQPWRSPRFLYHLALAEEWRQARAEGIYRRSTRGLSLEAVGFIHASHAHQIAATFRRFYADAGPVRLLTIDPLRLAAAGIVVREEPAAEGSGELFPHLHGPLPCDAVLAAEPYRP
jgi:glutathione S-transferase